MNLLWSDPTPSYQDEEDTKNRNRGAGICFNNRRIKEFLTLNRLTRIIRSHEVANYGFEYYNQKSQNCVTLFSAPNYCNK